MTVSINELTNHTYIDHELSVNLDSTDAFEGPEKLLEIWFYPSRKTIHTQGGEKKTLRSISFENWVQILKLVKCEVLSIKSTEKMDAFLLSESSMFVCDHKLTLKTCGTTTTLFCLEELFSLVQRELGWSYLNPKYDRIHPFKVFYSRRCFMFPLRQRSIHKNWCDEVEYLNKFFCLGKSYLVGRNDEGNHWNLYVTETNSELGDLEGDDMQDEENDDDETLEILMTGLDASKAQQFVTDRKPGVEIGEDHDNGHSLGLVTTQQTKLDQVYDNNANFSFHHDAFAFTPCGYSSNLILDEEYYYTLHVTPEKGWSYASFESNVPVSAVSDGTQDNIDVMKRVLNVFKPSAFCLTFFAKDIMNKNFTKLMKFCGGTEDYVKKDKIIYDLDDYHLLYLRFELRQDD